MRTVFLASAEDDLHEFRRYVVGRFGKAAWQNSLQQLEDSVRAIETFPEGGSVPDELAELYLDQYRQVMSGSNRIIYEIGRDVLYIHIVCDTRRDLATLLSRRLVRPGQLGKG